MLDFIEIAGAYSALGALAHLSKLHLSGSSLSLKTVLASISISVFAAALTFLVTMLMGWKLYGVGAACGVAAWMGEDILEFFEKRLLERLGGSKK